MKEHLFDKRVVQRALQEGLVDEEVYQRMLDALPDVSHKLQAAGASDESRETHSLRDSASVTDYSGDDDDDLDDEDDVDDEEDDEADDDSDDPAHAAPATPAAEPAYADVSEDSAEAEEDEEEDGEERAQDPGAFSSEL